MLRTGQNFFYLIHKTRNSFYAHCSSGQIGRPVGLPCRLGQTIAALADPSLPPNGQSYAALATSFPTMASPLPQWPHLCRPGLSSAALAPPLLPPWFLLCHPGLSLLCHPGLSSTTLASPLPPWPLLCCPGYLLCRPGHLICRPGHLICRPGPS
jgi:hypothetical protein